MAASHFGRVLLGAGVLGMLFGLSLVGIAGFGGGVSATPTGSHLTPATLSACSGSARLSLSPATLVAHQRMTGVVSYTFTGPTAVACSASAQVVVTGLPTGCAVQTSPNFACVPLVAGVFHVKATVTAQNTAMIVSDTVAVQ